MKRPVYILQQDTSAACGFTTWDGEAMFVQFGGQGFGSVAKAKAAWAKRSKAWRDDHPVAYVQGSRGAKHFLPPLRVL